ncbi:hypothetical protein DFH09DRAFT_158350 [Mycena vulgaris]|nr:hypothetical protein DFH09DRAFT_158350 [Mycena vulgaris]
MDPGALLNPPFSKELLESSRRLSASETGLAAEFVAAGERRILDLDSTIDIARYQAPAELERLMQEREVLHQQVQHKRPLRLPPEIISGFLASTVLGTELDDFPNTPWYLSHVCQYWREVALGVPTLWSDIVITNPKRYSIERLETHLARSSNSPLKVLFWSTHSRDDPPSDLSSVLLERLVTCAPRWIAANIYITPHNFARLAGIRNRIPRLRYLRLCVFHHGRRFRSTEASDPFEIAPELRQVSLEELSGLHHPIVLPFSQLTRFESVATNRLLAETLPHTANLEQASLNLTGDYPQTIHLIFPPIRLPLLRHLFVSHLGFLGALELPALEELFMVDQRPEPLLDLRIRCPSVKLRILRVDGCNHRHISTILEASPTLETLAVMILPGDKSNDLIHSLTVRPISVPPVCIGTKVDSIAFGIYGGEIGQASFMAMVESRWRVPDEGGPCCRLRSVELLIQDSESITLSKAVVRRLQALEAEGLQVSILQGEEATTGLLGWRI